MDYRCSTLHRFCSPRLHMYIAIVILLCTVTSSASNTNHRSKLHLHRHNESQPLVINQTYSIRCTVNNCSSSEFAIIFSHISHHGGYLLGTHIPTFLHESQLNISRQQHHNNKCVRTMTFTATKALNGTTVQCAATTFNTWIYSRATWLQLQQTSTQGADPTETVIASTVQQISTQGADPTETVIASTDPTVDLPHMPSSSKTFHCNMLTVLLSMSSIILMYMYIL